MNMASQLPILSSALMDETAMGRLYSYFSGHESSTGTRLVLIVVLAVFVHVAVKVIRQLSEWTINKSRAQKNPVGFVTQQPKFTTLTRLIASGVTFAVYFFALGFLLQEFGVSLQKYLASGAIVGLAVSFGSQGLVQDVVTGLTLIFSDVMDVGDLVEITGTTMVIGRVEEVGLRFTTLLNFYNQIVFVPNRTIANVSRFLPGGIYAYADVQIPDGADRPQAIQTVGNIAQGMWRQFGAIILSEPVLDKVETVPGGGWDFVRVHFRIWPGQGGLIETTFRQQTVSAMKALDPTYADWQVPVTYRASAVSQI